VQNKRECEVTCFENCIYSLRLRRFTTDEFGIKKSGWNILRY